MAVMMTQGQRNLSQSSDQGEPEEPSPEEPSPEEPSPLSALGTLGWAQRGPH